MADEITIIAPKTIDETKALSKELALSALMPNALKKKPEDVMAIVLAGSEIGLAPMQAVRGLNIINGKIGMSADLMGALVKRSPVCEYLQLAESTGQVATYKTKRKGEPGETVISFTIEQAKAAFLTGDNWKKYPDAMLRARALTAICRAVYPDLCYGIYDPEELGAAPESAPESTPTAQRAHVEAVKESLKAELSKPPTPKQEITDAEIVPAPTPPKHSPPTLEERVKTAHSSEALKALIPELKAAPKEEQIKLKPIYDARRAELTKEGK